METRTGATRGAGSRGSGTTTKAGTEIRSRTATDASGTTTGTAGSGAATGAATSARGEGQPGTTRAARVVGRAGGPVRGGKTANGPMQDIGRADGPMHSVGTLLIDNYDSFSYNLFQVVGSFDPAICVVRNDELTVTEIRELAPVRIILSPGPGRPADAGVCEDVIRAFAGAVPILGVCLGHQAICEAFGATVTYAKELMHGKQSDSWIDSGSVLFKGLGDSTPVARYHSLAADPATMPDCLRVTARTDDGEVMAVEHMTKPVFGVQFHPESILTPEGKAMIANFLQV